MTSLTPDVPVHIFWTGGWDSTFRICQLVIGFKQEVQPIYVHSMREAGGQRLCIPHELQAMEYIREDLRRGFPDAARRLRRLLMVAQTELYCDAAGEVTLPQKVRGPGLREGWQFSPLGAVAAQWGHPIELSIEKSNDGHNPVGDSLIPHVERYGNTLRLKENVPDELFRKDDVNGIASFRHFHFPLLLTTRPRMREVAVEGGYLHILEESWSCTRFRPDSTQCGECYCCRGRIRDGVWKERPFDRWQ